MIDSDNFPQFLNNIKSQIRSIGPNRELPPAFFAPDFKAPQGQYPGLYVDLPNQEIYATTFFRNADGSVGRKKLPELYFVRTDLGRTLDREVGVVISAQWALEELLLLKEYGAESIPTLKILPPGTRKRQNLMRRGH